MPNDPPATPLVPPRPNLGPEPWPDAGPGWTAPVGGGLALAAALVAVAAWRRRARRRSAVAPRAEAEPIPVDPRIEAADAVRAALAAGLGPGWPSRTTEEVAADPDLARRLGADRLAELAALLRQGDRAKFADPTKLGAGDEAAPTPEVVAAVVAAIQVAAREPEPTPTPPEGGRRRRVSPAWRRRRRG